MTVFLPEIQELCQLSEFLRSFMNTELESTKLRRFLSENKGEAEAALWNKLKELDLPSAFGEGGSPESGLAGLAQVAYECGRGAMPLPLWETLTCGPYLFGQLKIDSPETIRQSLRSERAVFVLASKSAPAVRGLSSSNWLLKVKESSAELWKLSPVAIKQHTDELDLLGSYAAADQSKLEKPIACNLPQGFLTSLRLLVAAELSGIAAKCVEMTVEYLKIRKQFDVPVGGFQAVQHKAADMHLHSEAMAALVSFALRSHGRDLKEFTIAAESALSYACDYTGLVIENAIQLHGGIGFTWEHDLHLYLRRAKQLEFTFSPSDEDLGKVVAAVV